MAIAISLSGGGSKGDFEVGAIRALYDRGIRPDILTGSSVGAINAAKLAEGEDPANPAQGLPGLEAIWSTLQRNEDMYLEEEWLHDPRMDPRVRGALTGHAAGLEIVGPPQDFPDWGDLGFIPCAVAGLQFLMGDGRALLESLGVLVERARALYNLKPISARLASDFDPSKIAAWAAAGGRLRLGMVGLESGRLRYVTETGAVVERDGTSVLEHREIPDTCRPLYATVDGLEAEVRQLQKQLQSDPGNKPEIFARIGELQDELAHTRESFDECVRNHPAEALHVSLALGILASSSIPGIFPPVNLGNETYVDGGVREILPVQIAADLGADEIYAVVASAPEHPMPARRYHNAKLLDIVSRSVQDILLDEVTRDDGHAIVASGAKQPKVFLIAPDVELHSTTTIEPGLIQINRDYGYMRATDVLDAVDRHSRRWLLSTEIALVRRDVWAAENRVAGQPDPRYPSIPTAAPDPGAQTDVDNGKANLRRLIEERRAHSGPMPAGIDAWCVLPELHPWRSRPPARDAVFVSQSVPTSIAEGQTADVTVTMRNVGLETWTPGSLYRLGAQNPHDNVTWGFSRVDVAGPVAVGEETTFRFRITAPAVPGHYAFQWRMLQEAVEWFGQHTPSVTLAVGSTTTTTVPDVVEMSSPMAARTLRAAKLIAAFTGSNGARSWVVTQQPEAGSTVERGSTVKCELWSDEPSSR